MKIGFDLYYKYSEALVIKLFDLIKNQKLWFTISQMRLDTEYSFDEGLLLLNLTANADYFKDGKVLATDANEENSFWLFVKDLNTISITCKFETIEKFFQNEPFFLNNLIKENVDFIIGSASDYDFSIKEELDDIQTHELLFGKVPAFKIKRDDEGYEYIDESKCFGRTEYISGVGVTVAWRMYFGKLFYLKTKTEVSIKNFKSFENKIIGDVIFVELFKAPEQANTDTGYAKLKEFRKSIGLDLALSNIEGFV